jgi:hypothetical protein
MARCATSDIASRDLEDANPCLVIAVSPNGAQPSTSRRPPANNDRRPVGTWPHGSPGQVLGPATGSVIKVAGVHDTPTCAAGRSCSAARHATCDLSGAGSTVEPCTQQSPSHRAQSTPCRGWSCATSPSPRRGPDGLWCTWSPPRSTCTTSGRSAASATRRRNCRGSWAVMLPCTTRAATPWWCYPVIASSDRGNGDETLDPQRALLSEKHNGAFAEWLLVPERNLVPSRRASPSTRRPASRWPGVPPTGCCSRAPRSRRATGFSCMVPAAA